jgi:hypothetical protein
MEWKGVRQENEIVVVSAETNKEVSVAWKNGQDKGQQFQKKK